MTKQEQKLIIDTIENVYAEKINKLTEDLELEKSKKVSVKEKITNLETENKSLKLKIKELEKELNSANKIVLKYDKLINSLKS